MTRQISKTAFAAGASAFAPGSEDSGIAAGRQQHGCNALQRGQFRLRTLDGLAPESRFSWLEDLAVGQREVARV